MDWSEKHISFAFTLKADTQLGKEEESGNVSWPRTLIVISQALLHHQIFIKKTPSLSPGTGALVFSEYLHLCLCGKFANTNKV